MDREQAIKIIKECKEKSFKRTLYTLDEYYEAVDMAIKALEQEPDAIHNEREQAYMKGYGDASKRFRTEPCEDEELDFVQPHKKIKVNLVKFDTPYTDTISRQAAIDAMREDTCWSCWDAKYILEHLPSVNTEKTDAYKQGWHDAISMALKETHNVYTDDGVFRVVQEETLIGVGMAYEQVSTEKTGRWIGDKSYPICPKCNCNIIEEYISCSDYAEMYKPMKYCPNCDAKMGVEE